MTRGATLFSGFEGVGCGMKEAGITHAWGIEHDPDIAAVAQRNGFSVTVADILDCDPFDFEPVDVLHASPPCPNFSVAKAGGKETEQDIALGRKVAEFVDVLRPSLFTLENVYGYRKAESFRHIVKALRDIGYKVRWWHLNSADYGVPQTRKRLIMVAALDFIPQRPEATHAPAGSTSPLFDSRRQWVGWDIAASGVDLPLGTVPRFITEWYGGVADGLLNAKDKNERGNGTRPPGEPAFTITAEHTPKRIKVVNGDVRDNTPRLNARFQSFPDWYELPDSKTLACRGIGNAVPPLLYRRVLEALI